LKQYNNRWFLFGLNNDRKELSNLALDRIQNIEEVKIDYIEINIDFNDYFYNVIGVTVKEGIPTEKVVLFINNQRWAYVKTKPIHGTQKVKNEDSLGVTIEIDIQINKELVNVILSYGSDMKVLEPKHLKEQIINKIKQMNENYFDV
jgi:predicted DNA-binding transcriptional regulator YafY